jgi:3-methyladenine DNA glycosylase AlkD
VTLQECLDFLHAEASAEVRRTMRERFGIDDPTAFGVPMGRLRDFTRRAAKDHALAASLWAAGQYEARILAVLLDDPAQVGAAQMDRWAADFDSWAICDTACFHLFDRTADAWGRVPVWLAAERLYVRRAGLALIWALSVHDRAAPDARFAEAALAAATVADDPRPHVRKAVSMALRATGKRNATLNAAVIDVATGMIADDRPVAGRTAREVLRELQGAAVRQRLGL